MVHSDVLCVAMHCHLQQAVCRCMSGARLSSTATLQLFSSTHGHGGCMSHLQLLEQLPSNAAALGTSGL